MDFYKALYEHYDEIFPVKEMTFSFLKEVFKDKKNILDIAAGTGGYAKKLEEVGFNVDALELDESMIEGIKARKLKGEIYEFGMESIDKIDKRYDGIYCIGNSLVHLNNKEEIFDFIKKAKNHLTDEGKLIIQIVNYDRILKYDLDCLPTIEVKEKNLTFERLYSKEGKYIKFNGIITKEDEKLSSESVNLYPIQSEELIKIIKEVGFSKVEVFGGFDKSNYSNKSMALVIKAKL